MNVVHPTRFKKSINLIGNMMQLQICCVLLSVVSVLAQYRHQWPHSSYGPSTASYIISHKIPAIEEFKRGWMGFYEYRPIFSRILFGSISDSAEMWKPAGGENIYKGLGRPAAHLLPVYTPPASMVPDVGESEGFQNWKQELFGPSKQMELQQQRFLPGNSDSHELEEIVPDNINIGAQDDDSIHIKDDFNTTSVAVNVENEDDKGTDSEEKEENNHSMEEPENPDKNVVLDDDGKSEYPATSPELVELNPEKITSGEVSEDVAEPEVSNKGPSDPSESAEIHWNPWKSAFDYPSNEKRPATDFFHSSNRQQSSSEVPDPVKFATRDPFSKWWNSAEEFSVFSDDDTPDAGVSESSSEAVADPKPSISPVPSTTPEPIYKFGDQSVSDKPKTVYKHNYRKVTIDKNKRPAQAQTA